MLITVKWIVVDQDRIIGVEFFEYSKEHSRLVKQDNPFIF